MAFKQPATQLPTDKPIIEPTLCKQAELAGTNFTIWSILRVDTPDNDYHATQWELTVDCGNTFYRFYMNPSKARNKQLEELQDEKIPIPNMTLTQKEFVANNGRGERVVYYMLENVKPFKGAKRTK